MLLSAVNLAVVNDATDCSAFHAPAILKTFEIRPIGLLSHVFAGPKVMLFHAA